MKTSALDRIRSAKGAGVLAGCLAAALAPAEAAFTPLGLHPGYDLVNLRPDGFDVQVTGLRWLSDGRLAVAHWGGLHSKVTETQYGGKVYLLSGVDKVPPQVQAAEFATGLADPGGLEVVDDEIYVVGGKSLVYLPDNNGDDKADEVVKLSVWNEQHARHEFLFGLVHKDGKFHVASGVAVTLGRTMKPQANQNRGTWVQVDDQTGEHTYAAGGLRAPNGVGLGPEGGIFFTDNQGDWLPSSKLMHMQPGKFYGHHNEPPDPEFDPGGKAQMAPPVAWIQHRLIGHSPGEPLYAAQGPYAGQFLVGDVAYGGIQRISVEKVKGQYQGCVLRFTGGLEAGVNRLLWGPDGSLYVGGIGDGDDNNWGWKGKKYGLQRLVPNGKAVFEIHAVFSRPKGMTIEFSRPVGASGADRGNYSVKSWKNTPMDGYGAGSQQGVRTHAVAQAQKSPDGRMVYLELPDLEAGRVVHINVGGVTSEDGQNLWDGDAVYTLNNIGEGEPFDPGTVPVAAAAPGPRGGFEALARDGVLEVRVGAPGPFRIDLLDVRGARVAGLEGGEKGVHSLPTHDLRPGVYVLQVRTGETTARRPVAVY